MPRTVEDVRREIETEREDLSVAVGDLREEGAKLKSKLPVVAGGALASVVALKTLKRLIRR
jgi:hypothetical protein